MNYYLLSFESRPQGNLYFRSRFSGPASAAAQVVIKMDIKEEKQIA